MYAQVEKPKENKSRAVANSVAQKKSNRKQDFRFVDNRPEAVAQRKIQEKTNLYQANKTTQLVVQRQVDTGLVSNTVVYSKSGIRGIIIRESVSKPGLYYVEFPEGSVWRAADTLFMEPLEERSGSHGVGRLHPVLPEEPERAYPLGYDSEEQFRTVTRPVARAFRDSALVVTGSSVTGKSGDGTRRFRDKSFPLPGRRDPRPKVETRSDIDLGVVGLSDRHRGEVDERGFPIRGTRTSDLEQTYGRESVRETGHPSGIKFFPTMPTDRSGHERPRIERPHTPEGERDSLPHATNLGEAFGAGGLRIRRDQIPSSVDISEGAIIYVGSVRKKILYVSEFEGSVTIDYGTP